MEHVEENLCSGPSTPEHPPREGTAHAGAETQKQRRVEREILSARCGACDVHKKTVKVCLVIRQENGQRHKEFRTYGTTTQELLDLADGLKEQGWTHVAMEGTGVCLPTRV